MFNNNRCIHYKTNTNNTVIIKRFANNFLEQNKNRVLGLDIVRSIAILLVVYSHGSSFIPKSINLYYLIIAPCIDGVSIFFVLSGFLIGGILLRTIQKSSFTIKDLLNFWIRRWFRTLPNYFIILIGLLLYNIIIFKDHSQFSLKYLFFTQNLTSAHPLFFPEAWSLSVEEWFYLLFPITCFVLFKVLRNKSSSVLISAIIFLIIPFLLRLIYYLYGIGIANWDENYRKVVMFRLDSLMYGVIGAYIYQFRKELWIKYKNVCLWLSLAIILYLTLYIKFNPSDKSYLFVYHYNLESIATLLMLPFFSQVKSIKFKSLFFFFTFISIISYSMYLLNLTVVIGRIIPITMSLTGLKPYTNDYLVLLRYFLYWFYLIIGSYLLYRYYEKPITDLRDKIKVK